MATTWRIEGGGHFYEFPDNFEVTGLNRTYNYGERTIPGRDGFRVDRRAMQRKSARWVLNGRLQGTDQSDVNTKRDELMGAVSQLQGSDLLWLYNLEVNRRAPVRVKSVRDTREMSNTIAVSIIFEADSIPFWEELDLTHIDSKTQHWYDVETGNAPSDWLMYLGTVNTAIGHPSLVHGNLAIYVDVGKGIASAINTDANTPWGARTGNFSGASLVFTQNGVGRQFAVATLGFDNIRLRADKGTFAIQMEMRVTYPTANDQYFADINQFPGIGGLNDRIHLYLQANSTKVIFGNSIGEATGEMPAFAAGKKITLSGWWDIGGTIFEGTVGTVYARLFANGTRIGQAVGGAENFTPGVNLFAELMIGSDRDGGNRTPQAVTQYALWHQNMGDDFCKLAHSWDKFPEPRNRAFIWTNTILATTVLIVDNQKPSIELLQPSNSAEPATIAFSDFSGDFLRRLADSGGESETQVDTFYTPTLNNTYVRAAYRKRYH